MESPPAGHYKERKFKALLHWLHFSDLETTSTILYSLCAHTESMKMRAQVSPTTSSVQRPRGSSAVGGLAGRVIVVTAFSFLYIILISYTTS